ncbi:pyridoxal-phosphate dependent enzyme [Streptomyces sp. NPDC088752]|uniref:pyridoxal-phosphate dependent enzyme n=1 Tax=Streptomyces sp. NPDC088752 TaxID=3154963 RepID=UPI00343D77C1
MNTNPVRTPDIAQLYKAAKSVRSRVRHTPVIRLAAGELGVDVPVTLKLECLQHTGSFKVRGASYAVASRPAGTTEVCAASGGNHGAAVAWAARAEGLPATIFVPALSPRSKTDLIQSLGAQLHVVEGFYADALRESLTYAQAPGTLHIDAYDDPATVAGQSSLGLELIDDVPAGEPVLVGCGGGGLFAGVSLALAGRNPVLAVEPAAAASLATAVRVGAPCDVEVGGLAVDSLGARRAGQIATSVALGLGSEVLTVPDEAIARAQRLLWDALRVTAEPGGATALAGLLTHPERFPGAVTVIISGANVRSRPVD